MARLGPTRCRSRRGRRGRAAARPWGRPPLRRPRRHRPAGRAPLGETEDAPAASTPPTAPDGAGGRRPDLVPATDPDAGRTGKVPQAATPARRLPRYDAAMEGPFTVRQASEEDLPGIDLIYNAEILAGVATWDLEPWSEERRRRWFAAHAADPTQPVLVAVADGEVVGFAALSSVSEKGGWRFTREDTVYVRPDCQGRGVGRALLGTLLEQARALPIRLVVASVESTNARSLALHRSFGFATIGEYRNAGFKFGAWRSTTYLGLDLGDPRDRAVRIG